MRKFLSRVFGWPLLLIASVGYVSLLFYQRISGEDLE